MAAVYRRTIASLYVHKNYVSHIRFETEVPPQNLDVPP